jgi:hypothetical protein
MAGDDTGLAIEETVLNGGGFGQIIIVGLSAVALSRLSRRGSSPLTVSRTSGGWSLLTRAF